MKFLLHLANGRLTLKICPNGLDVYHKYTQAAQHIKGTLMQI